MGESESAASSPDEPAAQHVCHRWNPENLPKARISDGRPLWEPPLLDHSDLIDTKDCKSYTKRREAVLNYTKGDVVMATQILDYHTEDELLWDYELWIRDQALGARNIDEERFYFCLYNEVVLDQEEIMDDCPHRAPRCVGYWFVETEEGCGPWVLRVNTEHHEELRRSQEQPVSSTPTPPTNKQQQEANDNSPSAVANSSLPTSDSRPLPPTFLRPTTTLTPGLHLSVKTSQDDSSAPFQLAHRLISLLNHTDIDDHGDDVE